ISYFLRLSSEKFKDFMNILIFCPKIFETPDFYRLSTGAKDILSAISALNSGLKWLYVLATSTPESEWPTQSAITLKLIPRSIALDTKKWRRECTVKFCNPIRSQAFRIAPRGD